MTSRQMIAEESIIKGCRAVVEITNVEGRTLQNEIRKEKSVVALMRALFSHIRRVNGLVSQIRSSLIHIMHDQRDNLHTYDKQEIWDSPNLYRVFNINCMGLRDALRDTKRTLNQLERAEASMGHVNSAVEGEMASAISVLEGLGVLREEYNEYLKSHGKKPLTKPFR
jgi:hypothetical protein